MSTAPIGRTGHPVPVYLMPRTPRPVLAFLVATTVSCDGAPTHPPDAAPPTCGDASCRAAEITAAWAANPDGAIALIRGLEDATERVAIVDQLVHADPQRGRTLCGLLPAGVDRQRCENKTSRPHLTTAPPRRPTRPKPPTKRATAGATSATLILPPRLTPSAPRLAADPGACAAGDITCLTEAAREAAMAGDPRTASSRCRGISDPKWQSECAMVAAETVAHELRADTYAGVADLCLDAGQLAGRCVDRVSLKLATAAPAANAAAQDWTPAMDLATAAGAYWGAHSPALGDIVQGQIYAALAAAAYPQAATLTGDLLAIFPTSSHPHVVAGAALEMMRREGGKTQDLSAWADQLAATLAQRSTDADRTSRPRPPPTRFTPTWQTDRPGDDAYPAISYLGQGRRTWSPDPAIDRKIAVMEAACQVGSAAGRTMVQAAKSDEDPRVAWTAARLLDRPWRSRP